ncbi:Rne/Rng family ribonuclease [Pseudopontixanthobacter vadosimaris]|uniref:Rne/Rng family ribonuclease n=1 Tax=Pseudopontixanthobacter vadosimaris TaxID=2726450 RepID=UPI0014751483|nr:Rne/Rng family ribonuclease [Pseudopontixanthobacter vadosimaris]
MATRMLIDARHTEETRVAVLKGNRIEEFDFESAEHKQIKGNIYLAKVTRVEPSLQAAFVDFGGNRHGFLAFSEIHPDYYQIPKEDREQLLAEEAEAAEEEARLRSEEEDDGYSPGDEYDADEESSGSLAEDLAEDGLEEIDTSDKDRVSIIEDGNVEGDDDTDDDSDDDDENEEAGAEGGRGRGRRQGRGRQNNRQKKGGRSRAKEVDEVRAKRMALRRRYKIQDVVHRRQVMLVQVVKEERGNKGAALTTYLSLAGRYTVLMPNSSHGGGISRKISSAQDRKRLKQIVGDLDLPRSMGLIVRTAGLQRTKPEIKRDFDYLARLWDEIRENTLGSSAPALIHSDSDLIKRAIRDLYNREIEEVIVEGEAGYKSAKQFMKLLMPSHARRVKSYSDPVPLFQRHGAEDQLRAMYDPVVQLKSGGYLVINPTEALVSIDINSGRSTKEHGIEATATATNLEAAKEIARQLRLRDMAGLVVIDFIDMENNSNIRKVEKCMKDALKSDRARIQVGRISGFGLMEMSRQRLRTGVLEATTRECPHCDGTGLVRTASSAGLSALRLIEDEAARGKGSIIQLSASTEAAVYLLNAKRADLQEIEHRYNVSVEVLPEGEDEGAKMAVNSSGPRPTEAPRFEPIVDDDDDDDDDDEEVIDTDDAGDEDTRDERDESGGQNGNRRRRRGGRGRNRSGDGDDAARGRGGKRDDDDGSSSDKGEDDRDERNTGDGDDIADDEDKPRKRRRRGGRNRRNRGGRSQDEESQNGNGRNSDDARTDNDANGNGRGGKEDQPEAMTAEDAAKLQHVSEQLQDDIAVVTGPEGTPESAEAAAEVLEKPKPRARRRKKADAEPSSDTAASPGSGEPASDDDAKPAPKPRGRRKKAAEGEPGSSDEAPVAKKPRRAPRKKAVGDEGTGSDSSEKKDKTEGASAAKPRRSRSSSSAEMNPAAAGAELNDEPSRTVRDDGPGRDDPAGNEASSSPESSGAAAEPERSGPPRRGWWQRTFGT